MTTAELGDEQLREDPTVNELQRRAAELLGQEAALFLPTATMANQIALKIHTRPGCLLIAQERTHVMIFEAGGPAVHSGLVMMGLPGENGRITGEQIHEVVSRSEDVEPGSIVVLEQTHRSAGGRVWPFDELAASAEAARDLGLAVHLDGARIMNASAASGIPAAEYGRLADSVTICFSKGLGCPLGAVLASSEERIERAWRQKFLFGGRHAAGRRGRRGRAVRARPQRRPPRRRPCSRPALGRGPGRGGHRGRSGPSRRISSAFLSRPGWTSPEARARIRDAGRPRLGHAPRRPACGTYLGIEDEHIDHALDAIPRALGALVGA